MQKAAFHQGLRCLLRSKRKSARLNLEILTCDPLISTMNHPWFNVSNQMEESISVQWVNHIKGQGTKIPLVITSDYLERRSNSSQSTHPTG